MTRRTIQAQDESTPLLSHHTTADGEGRWSLARRRSSAFLSFLSEPEDKFGDEYQTFHRWRNVYLVVFVNFVYSFANFIQSAFETEFVQTLVCAEYYHASDPSGSPWATLPATGDPIDLCSVLWVDKRTSQVLTYSSVLSSITSCVASLLLANVLLPRFGRRSLTIGVIVASALVTGLMPFIPTHYSFNAAVPSTSTLSPTTGIHLYLYLFVAAGFFGIPQLAMLLLTQVMLLDIVRDDEKTSAFSLVGASVTLGMAASTFLIRFVLPYFGVSFSTLNHTGPFSPFWMVSGAYVVALLFVIAFLPETRGFAKSKSASRRSSFSSDMSPTDPNEVNTPSQHQTSSARTRPHSAFSAAWQALKNTLSLFLYFVPYQPSPGAKKDYKLCLMLIAMIFVDTISMIWNNLLVFCSGHLRFGPQDVTTLMGFFGITKGLYLLLALPWVVATVRIAVKKRMRQELVEAPTEELTTETRVAKREEAVIYTDRIVAIGSLAFDGIGFIAMGIAASYLSTSGIYGSIFILMFASGGICSVQALSVDCFLAQDRPTEDPVAARDSFLGFLNLIQTLLLTFGPLVNNFLYRWSMDHGVYGLVFFYTSWQSFMSLLAVACLGFFPH